MEKTLDFATDLWPFIVGIYELVIRRVPTSKNLSIIDNVVKVINFFVKNRRKPSVTDTIDALSDSPKNKVSVDRTKHIISIILLTLLFAPVMAQTNVTGKSARFYNADSVTVINEVAALQTTYGEVGAFYYNRQSDKWRCYDTNAGAWYDCNFGGGGGGGMLPAGNLINYDNSDVSFGGVATGFTDLDGNGQQVQWHDFSAFQIIDLDGDFTVDAAPSSGAVNLHAGVGGAMLDAQGGSIRVDNLGGATTVKASSLLTLDGDATSILASSALTITSSSGTINVTGDQHVEITTGLAGGDYVDLTASELYFNANTTIQASSDGDVQISAQTDLNLTGTNATISVNASGGIEFDAGGNAGMFLDGNIGSINMDFAPGGGLIINSDLGTDGQVLTSHGSNPPSWETPGGGSVTADNGLTVNTGSNVQLGGTLLQNTDVDGAFDMTFGSGTPITNFSTEVSGNIALYGPGTFPRVFMDGSNGTWSMQTGISGSTTSEFFIANGTQVSPASNGLIRVNKQATVSDTLNFIFQGFALVQSGDGANGYGTGIKFAAENSGGGGNENVGVIGFTYKDATPSSEDTRMVIKLLDNSLQYDAFQIWSDNATSTTHIKVAPLPTSCSGLGTGELANVAGVLNVCP